MVLVLALVALGLGGLVMWRSAPPTATTTAPTAATTTRSPPLSPAPDDGHDEQRTRVMLGEVVDDDGRGIGGAGVVVVIGEHTVARATADLDGHLRIGKIGPLLGPGPAERPAHPHGEAH